MNPFRVAAVIVVGFAAPALAVPPGFNFQGRLTDANGGNGQAAMVGTTLPIPLKVMVKDNASQPVNNESIQFSASAGSFNPNPANAGSDPNGIASTSYTLGPDQGIYTVTLQQLQTATA